MALGNREAAIKITLGYEGGYTNHPSDPGGPTNWGITIFDARRYWKPDATAEDVRAMPLATAVEIYRLHYWAPLACDADPAGVDLATFDYGVNSGIGRAGPCRKRCSVPGDPVATVKAICRERLRFVQGLRTWSVFGKGWGSRIANVEARGVRMALEALTVNPTVVKKKLGEEAATANTQAKKHGTGAAGTAVGGGGGSQGFDWTALDTSTKVGVVVVGVGFTLMLVWFAWHWWQNKQRAEAYLKVAKEA